MVTLDNDCRFCIHYDKDCSYGPIDKEEVEDISNKLRDTPSFIGVDISCLSFKEEKTDLGGD